MAKNMMVFVRKGAGDQQASELALQLAGRRGFQVMVLPPQNGDGIVLVTMGVAATEQDVVAFSAKPGVQRCILIGSISKDIHSTLVGAHGFFNWGY